MQAVKGVYSRGMIKLKEKLQLEENQEVTILVLDEEADGKDSVLRYAGMLADLSPEEEAVFDDTLKSPVRFQRVIQS